MTDVPPKIWRLKAKNKYIPIDYGNNIDNGVFDYSHHGRAVFRPRVRWANRQQSDIILFDKKLDMAELVSNMSTGKIFYQSIKLGYMSWLSNTGIAFVNGEQNTQS